ncbi:AMP-binding protein [Paenibacillus amylolyticus]|uniref:AMP-binding protein n=1 Tax=Paenibacillus amylolyticus TaxID=1451 RepID=A0A5M9WUH9_PAEAM|nr:F390 synthetase-related protein [Paenibacillus amylolyticus]KAA8785337.1 AMP-binding protein [Paenibacillus amylolyticus]
MSNPVRIVTHYALARGLRRWRTRAQLEQWQERRIIRHVERIRARSPFYQKWWGGLNATEWRQFPQIDKTVMMQHFDTLNTVGITKEEALVLAGESEDTRNFKQSSIQGVTVGLSSGTSGNRGIFLVSNREQDAWTGTVLAKLLPGGLWKPAKIAFFLRANSNLYESVKRGKLQFQYFDLLEHVDVLVERMEEYQPTVWVAPPSMLRMLADAYIMGRLTHVPDKIIAVAEVLDPLDRNVLERVFGQTVHQVYQCTEGFLGATCEHGTIHLNEDIVYIEKEYLDPATRRFVPVITDFSRTSQPIIRYRLNDILTEAAERCACGSLFTAIERIEGRCDDTLYFSHKYEGEAVSVFPDFISRAVIAASPAIEHYRVVQRGSGILEVSMQVSEDTDQERAQAAVLQELGKLAGRLQCVLPEVQFVPYTFEAGITKMRRVERRLD